MGIQFIHPENWLVVDEEVEEWPRSVSLQSPGTSFWSLHLYPLTAEKGLLLQEVVEAMTEEYDSLETRAVKGQIGEENAIGFDMHFYCLDLLVQAELRAFSHGRFTHLVLAQAESRDFDENRQLFQAITLSLMQSS